MRDLLDRWADILTDDEPDLSSFEYESEQDLHRLHASSALEPILRLVPDLFAKFYKCMELTKQWWALARDTYPDTLFKRRRPSETDDSRISSSSCEVDTNTSGISEQNEMKTNQEIKKTEVMIIDNQKIISSLHEEIEALEKREEKFEILKETFDKVSIEMEEKKRQQKRLIIEREQLNADENKDSVANIGANLHFLEGHIRLLEFQHSLLLEDFMIQLEIRPSIIRFQDDARMHLEMAQKTQEKHMTHIQKIRESHVEFSSNEKREKQFEVKTPVSLVLESVTSSPENISVIITPEPLDRREVDKDKGITLRNNNPKLDLTDNGSLNNKEPRRYTKAPLPEKRDRKLDPSNKNITYRKDCTVQQRRTSRENVEEKSNVLKDTKNKQTVGPVLHQQEQNAPVISKQARRASIQKQHIPNASEPLRRTYDVSKMAKPPTKDTQRSNDTNHNKTDVKEHTTKLNSNSNVNNTKPTYKTSVRPVKPIVRVKSPEPTRRPHHNCGSHQQAEAPGRLIKKRAPESTLIRKTEDTTKIVPKKPVGKEPKQVMRSTKGNNNNVPVVTDTRPGLKAT